MTSEINPLKERLKNLTPEQIRKLMSGKKRSSASSFAKMPRNPEQQYPLSRAQERIWFLAKLYPDSSLYNIPIAINIRSSEIDPDRLNEVINLIIRKNEIFRTTFHEHGGQVYQQLHSAFDLEVEFEDISRLDASIDQEEVIEKLGEHHGNSLFDLAKLPLLRVKLLKKAAKDYILYFNLHHMISDGWTNSLLARDSALYYDNPESHAQKKTTIQYLDYVKWEQEWLKSARCQKQLTFWQKELADFPEPLNFPRDLNPEGHSFEGRTEHCEIAYTVHEKVSVYCQKNSLTPYQFYISCYSLLLSRYTGNLDIVVGTPVANRNQASFQNTYGVFINSLPLRFKIDSYVSSGELITGFREMILQSMDNQEIPFSEIISAINPQRKLHENPLYNIHFAYQHFPQKEKSDEHALLPIDYQISKFDVNFWIKVAGDECTISVSYKNRLISREKIGRFMEHFLLLVEAVVAQPEVPFKALDFIPAQHLSQLAGEMSPYPEGSWISLFEKALRSHPTAIALIDEQGEMTYDELNRQASCMANALVRRGLKRDDIAIVRTGRNRRFFIAILACMKCGVTYLPVDERIPAKRFEHILNDSQAQIVLTENAVDKVNCLGFESISLAESGSGVFDNIVVQSEAIAYIVYTSGSTGKPKGVCVPHRALINYTHAMKKVVDESDEICSFAHVSALDADLGNTAIFLTLGFSGTLVVPSAEALIDPALLTAFFAKYPVDAIKIVPAHLNALKECLAAILPQKLLIFAGEKLNNQLLSEVRREAPALRIMNHYGPAEATISSLIFAVPAALHGGGVIPIGKPIDNTAVFLLDKDSNLVPKGGRGEICLAGVNVARGYLNQPELSEARFVRNLPLSSGPIYKTGDIGYVNEGDQVVFLDRRDRQVKVNGFRIELGEIETVLKKHPLVINCTVFISKNENGAQRLHGAVELIEGLESAQLRSYLAQYFAPVVIPVITVVVKIPVTRNGKVDTERLQELCAGSDGVRRGNQPSDLVELQLTTIFKLVLNVAIIHPDDQFFELGGHSLLAISLIAKVNKVFETNFPIATLFEYGSAHELAALIRRELKAGSRESSPYVTLIEKEQIEKEPGEKLVWAHPAGGNVMSYYPIAHALSATYTTKAFTAIDHHRKDDLSIKGMAAEYAATLREQRETSTTVLAGWSMGALIAHEMAILLADDESALPLILADQPVPHPGAVNLESYEEKLVSYIERIEVFAGEAIKLSSTTYNKLDYAVLRNEFIRLGLMPEEVSGDSFRVFLDVLVQHNKIVTDFSPSVYHGPTLLLKASEKIMLKTNNPQPEYFLEDLGWGDFCTDLTIIEVPGNHITMMTEKYATKTASLIHSWILARKS